MKKTKINGVYILDNLLFKDNRGHLLKSFSENFIIENQINTTFKECWFTFSRKNVIRGMHFQDGNLPAEKLVSIIKGSVLDVILDLRPNSNTYGEYFEFLLTEEIPKSIYIPKGCAHGYRVLKNNSIVMYNATEVHSANDDIGIKWDSFGYNWDIQNPIISERDKILPTFNEYTNSLCIE